MCTINLYPQRLQLFLPRMIYDIPHIDAFCRHGRRDSLSLLSHMQSKQVAPNETTYASLIRLVDADRKMKYAEGSL